MIDRFDPKRLMIDLIALPIIDRALGGRDRSYGNEGTRVLGEN